MTVFAGLIAFCLGSAQSAGSDTVKVGKETYVRGPELRVGGSISEPKFSRDGQFFSCIDQRPEGSYGDEKLRLIGGKSPSRSALVRFDLRTGKRQLLYSPTESETLMRVEPVGKGGDLLCSLAVGVPRGDLITWKAIFFPVTGNPAVLLDRAEARSFHFSASREDRKACALVVNPERKVRLIYLTNNAAKEVELPETAYQGGFAVRSKEGNPILFLQGTPPEYKFKGYFEFDLRFGTVKPVKEAPQGDEIQERDPAVEYFEEQRLAPDEVRNFNPVRALFAKSTKSSSKENRLLIDPCLIGSVEESEDGFAVCYLKEGGYYVRELLKKGP